MCPGEWTQACDEPADCPAGQTCEVLTNFPVETGCAPPPASYQPGLIVCKSNTDCGSGGPCVTYSCDSNDPGGPAWISTCGQNPWCVQFP
jgi:hypothetical protein